MYYFTIACPTVERTLEMIDRYVEHGVDSVQIDMPSRDPYGETDFVKAMMSQGLHVGYDTYMDAIREVRRKHPDIEISIVVYEDVIDSIGREAFADFLAEIKSSNNIICDLPEYHDILDQRGISYITMITYNDPEYDIEENLRYGEDHIAVMRTKRKTDALNRRYDTWKKRVKLAKDMGLKCKIFAIAEINNAKDLAERKNAGMDGALIGNVLMQLWDDEDALWKKLDEFQAFVE
ncbi:tryptophan synthase subunit alpha [Lachnospiraceae bacterium ASD3451]|nr:tryptophan synthase subunit alpha [Diplocloster agilis]MBU9744439.1 tryptophan synthase subunit alpha [Diplocloster agilis]